ncbi:hypothetical protein N7510_004355 [Penicillium lagena]|uniref:uncharacterized protein n=1 Tax=Penicillium lagena TaxID=94218 RepID=UPI00254161BB|nr:uncharacterized protein N7510_004355 [Penicillium lagena]KAJ5620371.1 hypothetical protein N7510_004355 [Penicillium lagena]
MSIPQLHMNLDGHCTAIYNNTLYAFSSDGLASISLEQNGTWKPLPKGNAVSGAACVVAGIEMDASDKALYVIGGSGASAQYSGLQRFSFKDQKWQTLQTPSTMMNNRTGHNAAYMESTNSILVYAGGQSDGTTTSAQTYIVSTENGKEISTPVNSEAPAAYQPSLLTWSDSLIALISDTSTDVFLYNATDWGWENSQVTLPSTIASSTRCALVSNSDGSKVLESFDMSDTTNPVSSLALLSAGGKPESPASPVGAPQRRSLSDYPSYNGKFAPKATLSDYSLAQGDNGMVAILSSSGDNTLAIFNTSTNSWVNAAAMFNDNSNQNVLKPTHTTMTTSTSTSSSTTSSTATNTSSQPAGIAAPASESPVSTNVIIGATLGGVIGFAVILGIILLLLRRRVKRQRAQQEQYGGRGSRSGKHQLDRLSFQDQGIEPLTLGAFPMAKSPVPLASASGDTSTILYGRTGEKSLKPPGTGVGYGLSPASTKDNNSHLSTIPSSRMGPPSVYTDLTASSDAAGKETQNQPGNRSTDEGWSKYFQGNNATNLASNRSTVSSSGYTKSDYRNSEWPMSTLPPLNLGFLDQHTGRVVSGSPTTEHTTVDRGRGLVIPESQSARISSADSISLNSDGEEKDGHRWTANSQQSWLGRPPSSQYSGTFYNDTQTLPGTASQFNALATDRARASGRKSSVVIPDEIDEHPMSGRSDNLNSDMSWLNLHAER